MERFARPCQKPSITVPGPGEVAIGGAQSDEQRREVLGARIWAWLLAVAAGVWRIRHQFAHVGYQPAHGTSQ